MIEPAAFFAAGSFSFSIYPIIAAQGEQGEEIEAIIIVAALIRPHGHTEEAADGFQPVFSPGGQGSAGPAGLHPQRMHDGFRFKDGPVRKQHMLRRLRMLIDIALQRVGKLTLPGILSEPDMVQGDIDGDFPIYRIL